MPRRQGIFPRLTHHTALFCCGVIFKQPHFSFCSLGLRNSEVPRSELSNITTRHVLKRDITRFRLPTPSSPNCLSSRTLPKQICFTRKSLGCHCHFLDVVPSTDILLGLLPETSLPIYFLRAAIEPKNTLKTKCLCF